MKNEKYLLAGADPGVSFRQIAKSQQLLLLSNFDIK